MSVDKSISHGWVVVAISVDESISNRRGVVCFKNNMGIGSTVAKAIYRYASKSSISWWCEREKF